MWIVAATLSLIFLQLANDVGGSWINLSWGIGIWFGIETVLMWELCKEYKLEKKKRDSLEEKVI